jgi:hypothetical protein
VESKTTCGLRFIYDAAGRTVVQTNLALTVKAKIIGGATQDTSLDAIRAALERPGGQLTVTGLGFGTLAINTPGGKKDLAWGPKPQTLSWENVGAGRAANVVWQCEVALLGCLSAADSGQVMEFTWEATFAVDNGGYTTRTIAGSLRIPMTRQAVGDSTLPDCADAYLEQYVPVRGPRVRPDYHPHGQPGQGDAQLHDHGHRSWPATRCPTGLSRRRPRTPTPAKRRWR